MTQENKALAKKDGGAIAKAGEPKTLRDLINTDYFKGQVACALPRHLKPDRFIRVATTAMLRTPKLMQCSQESFLSCLLSLSALGLEPDGRLAHLIPFEDRKNNRTDCTLIVDYKGLVELVMRTGRVSNIHADKVCENDEFEYDLGEVKKHKIDFRKPRGEAYAYYCVVRFKDGTTRAEVMSKEDVDAIRKRSRAGSFGPWVTDYDEMAKKTCFRRCFKWLPASAELAKAQDLDDDRRDPLRPGEIPLGSALQLGSPLPDHTPEAKPEPEDDPDDEDGEDDNEEQIPGAESQNDEIDEERADLQLMLEGHLEAMPRLFKQSCKTIGIASDEWKSAPTPALKKVLKLIEDSVGR
jgi:recombination protein RecT